MFRLILLFLVGVASALCLLMGAGMSVSVAMAGNDHHWEVYGGWTLAAFLLATHAGVLIQSIRHNTPRTSRATHGTKISP